MATTSKKTTAKKKTSAKKAPKKIVKKTSARTTTKKVTAKKKPAKKTTRKASASKKSTTKKPTKAMSPNQKLNVWNWAAAAAHAVSGIALIVLSNVTSRAVTTNYLTEDLIASTGDSTVLAQATRTLFDVNIVYLLASVFFIASISHIVSAIVRRKEYESEIESGINKARWIEVGLSSGVMLITLGLLTGISDVSVLITMFSMTLLSGLVLLMMELYKKSTIKSGKIGHVIAVVLALMPWVALKLSFLGAYKYGDGSLPVYSYWIAGTTFVLTTLLAYIVCRNYYKKDGLFASYVNTEKAYMVLSFAIKSALAWQVYVALLN